MSQKTYPTPTPSGKLDSSTFTSGLDPPGPNGLSDMDPSGRLQGPPYQGNNYDKFLGINLDKSPSLLISGSGGGTVRERAPCSFYGFLHFRKKKKR